MDATTLGGILTVALGCYVFLHLAGKQEQVEKAYRRMAQLRERRVADDAAKEGGSAKTAEPDDVPIAEVVPETAP